jgi:hypothetical protein
MRPILEKRGILSISNLGSILLNYPEKRNYDRQFAGSFSAEFYSSLRKGSVGRDGQQFEEAVREFLDLKLGNPGRIYWKLLYQMLQASAFLKQYYSSSFATYIISKYGIFAKKRDITEKQFLNISVSEWKHFLARANPWRELMGIGPNVFDFLFGDVIEARFVENSYKFDSANQHFLNVTGISKLIVPFNKDSATLFIKKLEIPYSLREINKGIYTYCSKTEKENYGFCWDQEKCKQCKVKNICEKNIKK